MSEQFSTYAVVLEQIRKAVEGCTKLKNLAHAQKVIADLCARLTEVEIPRDALPTVIEGLEMATAIPHAMGGTTADYPSINQSLTGTAEKLRQRMV